MYSTPSARVASFIPGEDVVIGMIAFGDDGRLAESPAQVRVAQLGAAQALDLAGAGDGVFDQAAVGEEVFDAGEAGDVADLVEDGQAQVFADARDGLEQGIIGAVLFLGQFVEVFFEGSDLGIVVADHGEVGFEGELTQGGGLQRPGAGLPRDRGCDGSGGRAGGCGLIDVS